MDGGTAVLGFFGLAFMTGVVVTLIVLEEARKNANRREVVSSTTTRATMHHPDILGGRRIQDVVGFIQERLMQEHRHSISHRAGLLKLQLDILAYSEAQSTGTALPDRLMTRDFHLRVRKLLARMDRDEKADKVA